MEMELGKRVKPEELARFLGVNVKTVREYYKKLGGIRLGSRYIFFERKVIDAISAEKWGLEGPGKEEREEKRTDIQHEEGCYNYLVEEAVSRLPPIWNPSCPI